MKKLERIKMALQRVLDSFSQASTDKGILVWDSENSLPVVDEQAYGLDEEGNRVPLADGDYITAEGATIHVENGVVMGVISDRQEEPIEEQPANEPEEPAAEPEPTAEPEPEPANEPEPEPEEPAAEPEPEEPAAEPEPVAEPEPEPVVEDEKDKRIAELEAENEELRKRIKELEDKPAAQPAAEEFKRQFSVKSTGNEKLDRLAQIMSAKK